MPHVAMLCTMIVLLTSQVMPPSVIRLLPDALETINLMTQALHENETAAEAHTPTPGMVAFLTFDDGPSRRITPHVLDILKEHGIRATFFVLPHSGVDDLYRRIINEGHVIGNHSFSHNFQLLYDPNNLDAFYEDTRRMSAFIQNMLGITTNLYRFPGGSMGRSAEIIAPRVEILNNLGYRHFDWHVSSGDTDRGPAGQNPESLTNNIVNNLGGRNRPIILMHDLWNETVIEALPMIISRLKAMGYSFGTLDEF